jgi:hypothetical protein
MILKLLAKAAIKYSESRPHDFAVGGDNNPYMLRWWWIPRNKWFNVYIHKFLKDDDDRALHDHPWASLSILCQGAIRENYIYLTRGGQMMSAWRDLLTGGLPLYRSSTFSHRIIVMPAENLPLTIFITGPKIREWGFHCLKGWRHWKDYVDMDSVGDIGRGCGEIDGEIIHCRECGKPHLKEQSTWSTCTVCQNK